MKPEQLENKSIFEIECQINNVFIKQPTFTFSVKNLRNIVFDEPQIYPLQKGHVIKRILSTVPSFECDMDLSNNRRNRWRLKYGNIIS